MTDFLLLAFIFLCAGVIAVPLATRFGLGSVLGYLIAGIVISPLLAALGVDVVAIQHFAEFGVVMMLFLVGLELEPKLLWEMRTRLLGLGGGQVLLTTAAITAVAMLLGQPWSVALAIGLVLALSSTAIVLQTLNEKGLMKSDGGQASFSVLLFQDIAVIPMLALIPLLALPELAGVAEVASGGDASSAGNGHGGGHGDNHGNSHADINLVDGTPAWLHAATDICAILLVIFGGNYLTGPMFRFIAVAQLRELFTAAALLFVIGVALLMTVVGLSPALGTFLAGVVLANSEYRHELESDIDPFKGLLLGLFFITVGAGINFSLLFDHVALIAALTAGLIALKAAILFLLATLMGIRGPGRWLMALGLAQAGEFGFVLLSFTVAKGVIPAPIADQLLLVVALSMVLTPLLFIIYDRVIVPAHAHSQEREADDMPPDSHIIVAGRGRVGGIVDRMLKAAGHTPTVIDYNAKQLEFLKRFGVRAYYGDATRPDLLHAAGIAEARLLVVALDERAQITEMVRYVVKHYPQVHVVARAINREHVYELWAVGCRDIVRETYDSSLRIGRSAFQALGAEAETAQAMVDVFNRYDRDAMVAVADAYDINTPTVENEEFIKRVLQYGEEKEPLLQQDVLEVLHNGAAARNASDPHTVQ